MNFRSRIFSFSRLSRFWIFNNTYEVTTNEKVERPSETTIENAEINFPKFTNVNVNVNVSGEREKNNG